MVNAINGLPGDQLECQLSLWYFSVMGELRKITVQISEDLLSSAQAYTGDGITETVRAGLQKLASMAAQREALKLRGKVQFSMSLDELRHDRE